MTKMSILHIAFAIYDVFNNQSVNKYIKCLKYNYVIPI